MTKAKINPDTIRFQPLFDEATIQKRVKELGRTITQDYQNDSLIVISVLKGAFIFTADLVREIKRPLTMDFIGVSSYQGTTSTGVVRITHDLSADIRDKHVLLIEDIVDTGRTVDYLVRMLQQRSPRSVKVCSLLNKPSAREVSLQVDYFGFEVAKEFVIGYGLDLDQRWRELPYIGRVE